MTTGYHTLAPAKINLGLEITGRRHDGLHEIVTILQAITLFDRFKWQDGEAPFTYHSPYGISPDIDLVQKILATASDVGSFRGTLRTEKDIPASAGLGGGSSDAAVALQLANPNATNLELHSAASRAGADVPFFLNGGTALATGTGTTLRQLRTPPMWLVVLTPHLLIPSKTRTLYGSLVASDFSDGSAVLEIADRLERDEKICGPLPNTFERSLMTYEVVRNAVRSLDRAGAEHTSISGAGPSIYTIAANFEKAASIAGRIPPEAGSVRIARTLPSGCQQARVKELARRIRGTSGLL